MDASIENPRKLLLGARAIARHIGDAGCTRTIYESARSGELPIFKLNGRVAAYADALDAAMREKEPVTLEARARRREFLGLPRRAAEVTSGADLFAPRQILHLIDRAEAMLAEGAAFLTSRHRERLEQALADVKAIAPRMSVDRSVSHSDVTKLLTLSRLVGGLGDVRESVKQRIAIEATVLARAIRTERKGFAVIDALIAKHCQPGRTGAAALTRINADLKAQKRKPISARVLYSRPAWKKKRPSVRSSKNKTTV